MCLVYCPKWSKESQCLNCVRVLVYFDTDLEIQLLFIELFSLTSKNCILISLNFLLKYVKLTFCCNF